jgi:hypothetical protein
MIKDYIVVYAFTIAELEYQVLHRCKDGYVPNGYVFVLRYETENRDGGNEITYQYFQCMVLFEPVIVNK